MSTSRRQRAAILVTALLALSLSACVTDLGAPSGEGAAAPSPSPTEEGAVGGEGAAGDLDAPSLIYGGACEAMSTNAPDGWVEPVLAGPVPATWSLQIAALGGIECHRQGDESATIVALPAQLRPSGAAPEGATCPQEMECTIDVVIGGAWISGWVSPAVEGGEPAEQFVVAFADGLVSPDPLPSRAYPSPTGRTLCDDPTAIDSLERALDVTFTDAITETQYGGYAPAITEVANPIASRCNLVWLDGGERHQAEVSVLPTAGWTIERIASGEATAVDGADEARWIAPEDPFEFRRLVVRAGDDLVLVSVVSGAEIETAQQIAEAALVGR